MRYRTIQSRLRCSMMTKVQLRRIFKKMKGISDRDSGVIGTQENTQWCDAVGQELQPYKKYRAYN